MVRKLFVLSHVGTSASLKENVDLEEAFDLTGHGRYNYLLLFTCCIIHLGATMDMLGYSLVVPAATCDLQLSLEDSGMLTSVGFAGVVFALPWGYAVDTRGRKRGLVLSSSVGFVISCFTSFSTSFYMMLVLKFLATSFSMASITFTIIYLGECTSIKYRSKFLNIQNVCIMVADFVCFDFNIPIPLLTTFRPWRLLTLVMTVPLGVGALMMCFLHESPIFLANLGDTDKALEVLRSTYEINHGSGSVYPVQSMLKVEKVAPTSFWESIVKQTVPIFQPPLLWRNLQILLLVSICCSTNNVFFMWFPTMVNSFFTTHSEDISFCNRIIANITPDLNNDICVEKNPINTIYAGLLFTLFFTCLNIAIIPLSNWRRTILVITFVISGLSCVLVDIIDQPIATMVLFSAIQLTGICTGILGSFYVDIFPTSYRGLATGLAMMTARIVCFGSVNIVGATIVDRCRLTFYCWAAFVFSGILAAVFLPGKPKQESINSNET